MQVKFGTVKKQEVGLLSIKNGSVDNIKDNEDLYETRDGTQGKTQFIFTAKRNAVFFPKIKWYWRGDLQSKSDNTSFVASSLDSRECTGKPLETKYWTCAKNGTRILSSQICDGTINCCFKENGLCDEGDIEESDDENKVLCTGGNYYLILVAVGIYVFLGIFAYVGKLLKLYSLFT